MKLSKYFVSTDHEIHRQDRTGTFFVFRHGRWYSEYRNEKPDWLTEYPNLASARKAALKAWMKDFEVFKVESIPTGFNQKNDYYTKGDEEAPFWSESFLYPLLGKEDARTLLAKLRRLNDIAECQK
jgi:hypothetical protein